MTLTIRQLVGLVLVVALISSMTVFVAGVAMLRYAEQQAQAAKVAPGTGGGWVPGFVPEPAPARAQPSFWEQERQREQEQRIRDLEQQQRNQCFYNPSACR